MPRRRREGFDYFVDKYEDSYDDYGNYNNYFEERDSYIPGQDRFNRRNKYTGEYQDQRQFVNTSSVYTGRPQPQGTIEFSAVPNLNGLNPYDRPLGTQTLMINPNPYLTSQNNIQQVLETQQIQLDKQKEEIQNRFDELADKIDNLTNVVEEKTQTLSFKNEEPKAASVSTPAPVVVPTQETKVPTPAPRVAGATQAMRVNPQRNTMTMQRPMPTRTMQVPPRPAAKPKKKRKLSKGVLIGAIIGIIVAIGLIVFGVLLAVGIISF